MATLAYRIVNVFTQDRRALSGNPLCVFESGTDLDTVTMQALARQFNLSETTFILPSTKAHARVRIFTPSYEMPFAGHPTLGTAFVCRALGLGADELTLEMQAGLIPVRATGDRWTFQARPATWRELAESTATLAAALGIHASDIAARPLWVKAGKEQLIVPLSSEVAVRRVRPDSAALSSIVSEDGHSMAYVFAELGHERVLSRFFFPNGTSFLEDPATGSATANYGGWLIAMGRTPCRRDISQGEYAARPSSLHLTVDAEQRIFVAGDVVELGRGTLHL